MRTLTFLTLTLAALGCNSLLGIEKHDVAARDSQTAAGNGNASAGSGSTQTAGAASSGETATGGSVGTRITGGGTPSSEPPPTILNSGGTQANGSGSGGTSVSIGGSSAGGRQGSTASDSAAGGGLLVVGTSTSVSGASTRGGANAAGRSSANGGVQPAGGAAQGGGNGRAGATTASGNTAGGTASGGTTVSSGMAGMAGLTGDGTAIGSLNQPCLVEGAYACAGHAQKGQLICSGGRWTSNGTCGAGYNCDTTLGTSAGACAPILGWCSAANAMRCNGPAVEQCGLDLVTSRTIQTCGGDLPICLNGACVECSVGGRRCDPTQSNSNQICDANGKWSNPTTCSNQTCVEGSCVGECAPNQRRCDIGGTKGVQSCTAAGQWSSPALCAMSMLCRNGACTPCPGTGGPSMVGLPPGLDYCIDSTEVTCAQYKAWLATGAATSTQIADCSWNDSFVPQDSWMNQDMNSKNPVGFVDWCDAVAYCKGVGKRLCGRIGGSSLDWEEYANVSQSQWYAACTSNRIFEFPYGNQYGSGVCNDVSAGFGSLVEVGMMSGCHSPLSSYSNILDMSGNALEWEDSCSGHAPDDPCRTRGGFYRLDNGIPLACGYAESATRSFGNPFTSFRCCAE